MRRRCAAVCAAAEATEAIVTTAKIPTIDLMRMLMRCLRPTPLQDFIEAKCSAVTVNRTTIRCQAGLNTTLLPGTKMKGGNSTRPVSRSESQGIACDVVLVSKRSLENYSAELDQGSGCFFE